MKKAFLFLPALAIVAGGASAGSIKEAGGADPLQGSWYGGSSNPDHAGYKYHYTFIPTGSDRWYVEAQPSYTAATFGGAILSNFTGEVVLVDGAYEVRLLAMMGKDPVDPPGELPTVIAGRGWITLTSENGATIEYDFGGFYEWGKTPFVDEPAIQNISPEATVKEVIHRMRVDVEIQ